MTVKKEYLKMIKNCSIQEIEEEIIRLKKEIIFCKIKLKAKQKIKTHIIKKHKKSIAQLLTLQTIYSKLNE